ncbi:hypothetical protein [Dyadobacter crusticola]|uniref:hypothetical protein n=1 Tax=Dyadobacter crusticola TaxID=292407 RepID=UPI0004E28007|nr:hypothetical protein [Dyadobacter crusticola]
MTKITVAKGDGIGPEIMDATIEIILWGGAQLEMDFIELVEQVYLTENLYNSMVHQDFPGTRSMMVSQMHFNHCSKSIL